MSNKLFYNRTFIWIELILLIFVSIGYAMVAGGLFQNLFGTYVPNQSECIAVGAGCAEIDYYWSPIIGQYLLTWAEVLFLTYLAVFIFLKFNKRVQK